MQSPYTKVKQQNNSISKWEKQKNTVNKTEYIQ